jgi:hypothetical protein
VCFSPDGKRILTEEKLPGRDRGTVRAWSTVTGDEILPCTDAPPPPEQLKATSSDGSLRVVASFTSVKLYYFFPRDPHERAQQQEIERRKQRLWHQQQAQESEQARQWFAARFHLGQLLRMEPSNLILYARRGVAWAEQGQRDQAVADFARASQLKLDPDRWAAVYVLSIGGSIKVDGQEWEIRTAAELPAEAFRLTWAHFRDSQRVNDEGLAAFKNCKNLSELHLMRPQIGDRGLAHFKDARSLTLLDVSWTKVSDAGLAHFKDCKALRHVNLWACQQVGNAGVSHFARCKSLTFLNLGLTRVNDVGLRPFQDCTGLQALFLNGTAVSDEGLTHFKNCKNLTALGLGGTRVSTAGLAHFKDCPLTTLHIQGTQVRDLSLLKGMPLKELTCDFKPKRDAEVLRSIKTLERINGKPAAEFWKEVDAKKE